MFRFARLAVTLLASAALVGCGAPMDPGDPSLGSSQQAVGPDPADVYIESLTYGGTGCPQGSVGQSMSDDRSNFTLVFDEFVASTGPGISPHERSKECQLEMNLHVPSGWTYSVTSVDYRGYVQLDAGMKATLRATYSFDGVDILEPHRTFEGPVSKDYLVHDSTPIQTQGVQAPCGVVTPLGIDSTLQIVPRSNHTGEGQITIDSQDGKVTTIMGIELHHC
jgi:hypothetical protein